MNLYATCKPLKRLAFGIDYKFMPRSLKPMITFVMEEDLLQRVEDFRYQHRYPSRAAAMKALMNWALEHYPAEPPPKKKAKTRGSDTP
jgi:hypothetical protein